MKAYYLVKNGAASTAFELQDIQALTPGNDDVIIDTEAFGLNFADVMARLGYYKACPPLPTVIGYDVVGRIIEKGKNVEELNVGQRVVALTRFGGYSHQVRVNQSGVVAVPENADAAELTALATQFVTAYYSSSVAMQLHQGDHVLIQAAAGGVGTALIQLAKRKGCILYGTAGSKEKCDFIKTLGVDFAINYREVDFVEAIKKIRGDKGIDVVFDSIGGDYVKKGIKLLAPGGRIAFFGAAQIAGAGNEKSLFRQLKTLWGFGKYRPTQFFAESQSVIGVNMLKIGDFKPQIIQSCLKDLVKLYEAGEIKPVVGKMIEHNQLAEAHELLQKRQTMGKLTMKW
jgi:NADPH2:quinone reductase